MTYRLVLDLFQTRRSAQFFSKQAVSEREAVRHRLVFATSPSLAAYSLQLPAELGPLVSLASLAVVGPSTVERQGAQVPWRLSTLGRPGA